MNEMVERVARAIWRASVGSAQWDAWETFAPDAWGRVRSMAQARAAIDAMREPTFHMERASGQCLDNASTEDVLSCWQAMIDAALAPPPEQGGTA